MDNRLSRPQLIVLKKADNQAKRGEVTAMYMSPDIQNLMNLDLIQKVPGYVFGTVFTITDAGKKRLAEEWDDAILK